MATELNITGSFRDTCKLAHVLQFISQTVLVYQNNQYKIEFKYFFLENAIYITRMLIFTRTPLLQ